MDEHSLNRRQLIGGFAAAAGGVGLLGALTPDRSAAAAPEATPDAGPSQAPTITDMKDKVAYVTGGSSGIGLGIARVLHEAGVKVVIGYINDQQIVEALKFFPVGDSRVHAIKHDVMDRDAWQRTADEIEKKFGLVNILVNNAGVGLQAPASTGTLKDWEWGLGVNLWGPIYGVHAFVPRMLAGNQGSQIVTTTSTSGILPGSGAGIYTVSKIAAVGLMEELRHELRATNIGTSAFIPGLTTTNIGRSETYRPESLKNEGPPALAPGAQPRSAGAPLPRAPARPVPAAGLPPEWVRPQDPLVVGRFVLDGILRNDLFIVLQSEYRIGVEARCNALLESMVPFTPMPEAMKSGNYLRTPIYVQEIAHRKATQKRVIQGVSPAIAGIVAPNVVAISPTLVTAGQPNRDSLLRLKSEGYDAVVYLAPGDSADAIPDEAQIIKGQGIEFVHIPIPWQAPEVQHLQTSIAALRRLRGRKVLVHCQLNMRASVITYLYRVLDAKEDPAAAWVDVKKVWTPTEKWAAFIDDQLGAAGVAFKPE